MALNRYFRPGQSQYISQYVPYKLPFELWQQQIQQKDAKVQSDIDALKSQYGQTVTGTDYAELGDYYKTVYGDSPELARIIQDMGEVEIGDRMRSQKSADAINTQIDEMLSDDYVMKSLTGDLADGIIKLNGAVKQHNTMNALYDQRTKSLEGIYKSIANKKDWELDPSLVFQQEMEIEKMNPNSPYYIPGYIPKETGIGDYFDASKYILDEVNRMKDSGGKSYDYSDPLYVKWNSSHGVSADKYANFAEDIWNNENSPVRADAERRINALIEKGYYTEADRAALLEYEKEKLKETAKNLQHRTSDTGERYRSRDEQEDVSAGKMFVEDQAIQETINGQSISLNGLGTSSEDMKKYYETYKQEISSKLPPEFLNSLGGIDAILAKGYTIEELEGFNRRYNTGIPTYELSNMLSQLQNMKVQSDNLSNQYLLNDTNARISTGFTTGNQNTYNLFNSIKRNPQQAIYLYNQALNDPNSQYRNTPEFKELEQIKIGNPALYSELIGLSTGESSLLGLYSSTDFQDANGNFDKDNAYRFLTAQGIEVEVTSSGIILTESMFDKLIKENTNINGELYKSNQKLNTYKSEYDLVSNTVVQVTPDRLNTLPGMTTTYKPEDLKYMNQFMDPYNSKVNVNGQTITDPNIIYSLNQTILNSNKPLVMTMTAGGQYIYNGTTTNNLLQDPEMANVFRDEYVRKYSNGEIDNYAELSDIEKKVVDENLKNYLSGTSNIQIELSAPKSTSFTSYNLKKIETHNKNLNGSEPEYYNSIYTENVILNRDNIDKANSLNQTVGYVDYSASANGQNGLVAYGYKPVNTNINFQIKDYSNGGGNVYTENVTLTKIAPSEVKGSDPYNFVQVNSVNVNGSTNSHTTDQSSNVQMQVINGKPVYEYYFVDSNGNPLNNGEPIPAFTAEEALEQISNSINVPQQ